jgi:hypothetical protein
MSHQKSSNSSYSKNEQREHRIYFLSALASMPVPFSLLTGLQIFIVAANGKTQPATLTLSVDRFTAYLRKDNATPTSRGSLRRTSSGPSSGGSSVFSFGFRDPKVEERAIDIGEMDRVQRGQSTQQFELAKKHVKADNKAIEEGLKKAELQRNHSSSSNSSVTASVAINQLDPALSFSIIFRGAHTVDLMAKSKHDRDEICDTLDRILQAYQRGKIRVSTDVLLLRYVWLDIDKAKTGYVTVNQIGQVLQAINFNMKQKDVVTAYDKFGKIIGLDRSNRRRGLTFEQSATFLHKVRSLRLQCSTYSGESKLLVHFVSNLFLRFF